MYTQGGNATDYYFHKKSVLCFNNVEFTKKFVKSMLLIKIS